MHDAFRAFAAELIDYAGLFPPAELPLDQALRQDLGYRSEPDRRMLGRFICPAARLAELPRIEPGLRNAPRFRVSALGRGGADTQGFLAGLRADLAAIREFHGELGRDDGVELLEVRAPAEVADGAANTWRELLLRAREAIEAAGLGALRLYCELPGPVNSPDPVARAAHALASFSASSKTVAGLKLRCGGVTTDAFPSVEFVARALASCRECGTSFKATAGLHHPIRSYRAEVRTRMHGFVNVFGAALLAHAHALRAHQIGPILESEDASEFAFTRDGFGWRELEISTEKIRALRGTLVTSFGSCSFDEPRADLRLLGWID